MRTLILAALSTVILLALSSSTALALRSIQTNQTRDNATGSALVLSSPEIEGFAITCEITLELEEIVARISKTRGARVGNIIGARIATERCRGGELKPLTVSRAAPWELQYESFNGTLPNVTLLTISIHNFAILMALLGSRCLYGGTFNVSLPVTGPEREREARSMSILAAPQVPLIRDLRGLIACPRLLSMGGSFTLERAIRITLA